MVVVNPRRRAGGCHPKRDLEDEAMISVTIRVPKSVDEWLKSTASAIGISKSQQASRIVKDSFNKHGRSTHDD